MQNFEKRILVSSGTNGLPLNEFTRNLIFEYFWKIGREYSGPIKSDKNNGTLHEDQCTYLIISRSVLLRMRNASDKSCRENRNTPFMFNNSFKIVPLMNKETFRAVKSMFHQDIERPQVAD